MSQPKPYDVKHPHPVDAHVGAKVRARRTALRLSQEMLGEKIGVTFQQVQKYERGANRISASALVKIAAALKVPPGYFVDDAPGATGAPPVQDGWLDAQRIVAQVPGAMEALYCLEGLPGHMRAHLVATLQIAAGRWMERRSAAAQAAA